MMQLLHFTTIAAVLATSFVLTAGAQQPPSGQQTPPQQPSDIRIAIEGPPGLPPRIAVPEFIALTNDAETIAAAKTISQVLWEDLNFEREFYMVGRDTYKTIPP